MALFRVFSLPILVLSVFVGLAAASTFISDEVLQFHGSGGRSLLQSKTSCPINFEFANYSIITTQCKGPKYPAEQCCGSFKEFACPYAEQLNDGTNDCATTMFSYINLYGKYPPGLFASECKEGKEGLACPALPPGAASDDSSSSYKILSLNSFALLACGVVLGLMLY